MELASRSITVNCIAPGIIETEMVKDAPVDLILQTVPMKRVGKPEEVSSLVVFLLSEQASYIYNLMKNVNSIKKSGGNISVNGGIA